MFEPTWESVRTHQVPEWYEDAKLGIFLHWGLYSVPGWAPQVANIQDLLQQHGPKAMLRDNPYAEWYMNTMQVEGSPTQQHHRATYGADYPYHRFAETFDEQSADADLDALAGLCADAGAGYVVLTTKHHEGFTLWPTEHQNPSRPGFIARRDLVGDLSGAVRDKGMRMGLYYSGGYDWTYNGYVMHRPADAMLATPVGDAYREYATAHVRELIDRYAPSVLWNDICWPGGGNLAELFAHYYNTVDDGVINDRWIESTTRRSPVADTLTGAAGDVLQAVWKFIPSDKKTLTFPGAKHYDFTTPEYAKSDTILERKWEATRGVGHSFGANRNERPEDVVTTTELVREFCDIISKNGNLLIGIGPGPDGTIPDEQQAPVRGLGDWMKINSVAVHGTRPWKIAQTTTSEGTQVRFTEGGGTQGETVLNAFLIDTPGQRTFSLRGIDAAHVGTVEMLGVKSAISHSVDDGVLTVTLPDRLPVSATHVLRLRGDIRPTR